VLLGARGGLTAHRRRPASGGRVRRCTAGRARATGPRGLLQREAGGDDAHQAGDGRCDAGPPFEGAPLSQAPMASAIDEGHRLRAPHSPAIFQPVMLLLDTRAYAPGGGGTLLAQQAAGAAAPRLAPSACGCRYFICMWAGRGSGRRRRRARCALEQPRLWPHAARQLPLSHKLRCGFEAQARFGGRPADQLWGFSGPFTQSAGFCGKGLL